jgi:hypothetical protein
MNQHVAPSTANEPADWMQFGTEPYDFGSTSFRNGILVNDVANALAKINRFTGHSYEPISVARHSVYVSKLLDFDTRTALYGLAHDAHEAIVGDKSTPYKRAIAKAIGWEAYEKFRALETAADAACHKLFGLEWPVPEDIVGLVHKADQVAVATERHHYMPGCTREWRMLTEKPSHVGPEYTKSWEADANLFVARFKELSRTLYGYSKTEELVV